ncbi:family 43 glycosylhydrolase [uncultured Sphingomonas sp.]|uniref:family 43 glycosylhydrolase n=1 Tax=uncultured Sphingomonas sp. TaxID=158754 RepID=UPI0035CC4AF6
MRRIRRLALIAGPLCAAAAVASGPSPYGHAIFAGADPAALVEDTTVWLYPTDGGKALYPWSSADLIHWRRGAALIERNRIGWIADGAPAHALWAPHMLAANGRYYLYYAVGPQEPRPSRIGVATCDTPAGPCRDSGRPLLDGGDSADFAGRPARGCADAMPPTGSGRYHFEAIDPMAFVDPRDGTGYLYAGGSNGETLRVFRLAPDMLTIAAEVPVAQPPCFTEGPWMHERDGVYYLSYSSGHWDRADYSVRYATAPGPTGPWTYRGVILRADRRYQGPGHHAFFRDPRTGGWVIAYHRWEHETGDGPYHDARQVALAPVRYAADGTIEPIDIEAR